MDAEYKKAAEKLLCGITDKRLHEPTICNDILSSVRSGKLRIWKINDEILRIKYFCKEKIERASAFTESDKSGVRFDDLNTYFVEAIKSRDKGYFGAFIRRMSQYCKAVPSGLLHIIICLRTILRTSSKSLRTSSKSFWKHCGLLSSAMMPPIPFRFYSMCKRRQQCGS